MAMRPFCPSKGAGQAIRLEETDGGSAKAHSAVSEGDEE